MFSPEIDEFIRQYARYLRLAAEQEAIIHSQCGLFSESDLFGAALIGRAERVEWLLKCAYGGY